MTDIGAAYPTTRSHHLADVDLAAPSVSHSYPTQYSFLPDGDGATFMTLDAMRDAVLGRLGPDYSGYQDPHINRAANQIIRAVDFDQRDPIAALFDYATQSIRYVEHPFNTQIVQDAKRTMQIGSADCVSLSVLLATLLGSLGYQSRFAAQWVNGHEASHVYLEVLLNDGQWLALDAVARDKPMGWRQPKMDGGFEVQWEIF